MGQRRAQGAEGRYVDGIEFLSRGLALGVIRVTELLDKPGYAVSHRLIGRAPNSIPCAARSTMQPM